MIRSIAAVLVATFFPLVHACAANGEPAIPQLESSTFGSSKVAARLTFHRTRAGAMEEAVCAENNIASGVSAVATGRW